MARVNGMALALSIDLIFIVLYLLIQKLRPCTWAFNKLQGAYNTHVAFHITLRAGTRLHNVVFEKEGGGVACYGRRMLRCGRHVHCSTGDRH